MNFIGKGRAAIELLVDAGSFQENIVGAASFDPAYAQPAVVGTAQLDGRPATVIANDARKSNPRFKVVYSGVIGLEEAYKMAEAVYASIEADRARPPAEKRPILLVVDTPGNAPGKLEEIIGMNKATVAYQLALSEARKAGHPSAALVVGRGISGAFLCHGLHAGSVFSLSERYGTMVHVMPLTSIARITKIPLEELQRHVVDNPVFASGPAFVHKLGGINEIVDDMAQARPMIIQAIAAQRAAFPRGEEHGFGPVGRMRLGIERGGRPAIGAVLRRMRLEAQDALQALGLAVSIPAAGPGPGA